MWSNAPRQASQKIQISWLFQWRVRRREQFFYKFFGAAGLLSRQSLENRKARLQCMHRYQELVSWIVLES